LTAYEQAMFVRSAEAALEGDQLHRLLTGDNAAASLAAMLQAGAAGEPPA